MTDETNDRVFWLFVAALVTALGVVLWKMTMEVCR